MDTPPPREPEPGQSRWRFALRLRTLMLIVLMVAGLLWLQAERERREAVSAMIALLPKGVLVRVGPDGGGDRANQDATWATLGQAFGRVQALHAEPILNSALRTALYEALTKHPVATDRTELTHYQISKAAIASLIWLGPRASGAAPELVRVLASDQTPHLRLYAAHALTLIAPDDPRIIPALVAAMRDRDSLVAQQAALSLGDLRNRALPAIPVLIAALKSDDDLVRYRSAWALGKIGATPPGVISALLESIHDPNAPTRAAALRALGDLHASSPNVVAALTAALKDPNPSVRGQAAWTLGDFELEALSALPALNEALAAETNAVARSNLQRAIVLIPYPLKIQQRHQELLRMIATDRARGGRPRTKPQQWEPVHE